MLHRVEGRSGPPGLETLLAEVVRLRRVRAIGLPERLFADVAEKRIARWRARAAAEYPSTLRRDHGPEVALTLLAVLCWCRPADLTDSLVELFIDLVQVINTWADSVSHSSGSREPSRACSYRSRSLPPPSPMTCPLRS